MRLSHASFTRGIPPRRVEIGPGAAPPPTLPRRHAAARAPTSPATTRPRPTVTPAQADAPGHPIHNYGHAFAPRARLRTPRAHGATANPAAAPEIAASWLRAPRPPARTARRRTCSLIHHVSSVPRADAPPVGCAMMAGAGLSPSSLAAASARCRTQARPLRTHNVAPVSRQSSKAPPQRRRGGDQGRLEACAAGDTGGGGGGVDDGR